MAIGTAWLANHQYCILLRWSAQFLLLRIVLLEAVHFKKPTFSRNPGLWLYHNRMTRCFDEISEAAHSWLWWMEWSEGWGCGVEVARLKQGTPSWEHTSESSICSLRQVLMGRNPRARILLAAPPTGNAHTHTRMPYMATQAQTNINTDVQWTHIHTQTLDSCNWKLHSWCGLSENARTHFSPAPSSSCPWPLDLSTSSASVTVHWRQRSAFQQTREQPSAFDAALPWCSMLIHPHEQGWDDSKMTRETLFVISCGGNSVSVSCLVAKRICLSEVPLLRVFKSLLTTEFLPGLDLQFHYDGPDSISRRIDSRCLIILH